LVKLYLPPPFLLGQSGSSAKPLPLQNSINQYPYPRHGRTRVSLGQLLVTFLPPLLISHPRFCCCFFGPFSFFFLPRLARVPWRPTVCPDYWFTSLLFFCVRALFPLFDCGRPSYICLSVTLSFYLGVCCPKCCGVSVFFGGFLSFSRDSFGSLLANLPRGACFVEIADLSFFHFFEKGPSVYSSRLGGCDPFSFDALCNLEEPLSPGLLPQSGSFSPPVFYFQ